jgi:hypothetical protein
MRRITSKLPVACAFVCAVACVTVAAPVLAQEPAADEAAGAADRVREREALEPRVSSAPLEEETVPRRQEAGERVIDRLDLDRTEVTGNQELPKVLYIVPWQRSDPGDLMGRPVNSLLDEVLAPLDREEFIRQVDYYSDLYGVAGEEE